MTPAATQTNLFLRCITEGNVKTSRQRPQPLTRNLLGFESPVNRTGSPPDDKGGTCAASGSRALNHQRLSDSSSHISRPAPITTGPKCAASTFNPRKTKPEIARAVAEGPRGNATMTCGWKASCSVREKGRDGRWRRLQCTEAPDDRPRHVRLVKSGEALGELGAPATWDQLSRPAGLGFIVLCQSRQGPERCRKEKGI